MHARQIASFIDALRITHAAAQRTRAAIMRSHTGRWPTWHAHSMYACGDTIVELAMWCRMRSQRYAVLRWNLRAVSVTMRSFATLREARMCAYVEHASAFSVDMHLSQLGA